MKIINPNNILLYGQFNRKKNKLKEQVEKSKK